MTVIAFDYEALALAVHPPAAPVRGGPGRHAELPRRRRALPRGPALAERPARPAGAGAGRAPVRARPAAGPADRGRARTGGARPRRAAGDGRPGGGGHARGRSAERAPADRRDPHHLAVSATDGGAGAAPRSPEADRGVA